MYLFHDRSRRICSVPLRHLPTCITRPFLTIVFVPGMGDAFHIFVRQYREAINAIDIQETHVRNLKQSGGRVQITTSSVS